MLRPEAIESLFILHQLTGNPIYREWYKQTFTKNKSNVKQTLTNCRCVCGGHVQGMGNVPEHRKVSAHTESHTQQHNTIPTDGVSSFPVLPPPRYCKTQYGYGAYPDVRNTNRVPDDRMESFWIAETLKYHYLLQVL